MAPNPAAPLETQHDVAPPDLREIVRRLGGDLLNGGRKALVPAPGHSRRDRGLSLSLEGGRVVWCSFNDDTLTHPQVCSYLGLPDAAKGTKLSPRQVDRQRQERRRAEAAELARKLAFCRPLWGATLPVAGSPVEAYLRGRGITGALPPALRFHPAAPLAYPTEERPEPPTSPAMVAIVTGPKGTSCGLHVTAIKPDGSGKARGDRSRVMFGEMAGGAVQLSPPPARGELAVAEGIETALSYRDLTGTPTWAILSASLFKTFTPPPGLSRLVVAADGDPAGIAAARDLAQRAARKVTAAVIPAPEGFDWNDVAKGGAQ